MKETVEQFAARHGRSVEEVVDACGRANILAWGGSTPLDDREAAAVLGQLGAPAPGPANQPMAPGQPAPAWQATPPPPPPAPAFDAPAPGAPGGVASYSPAASPQDPWATAAPPPPPPPGAMAPPGAMSPPPPPGAPGYAWPPAAGGPVLAGPGPLRPASSGRGRRVVGFVLSAALILGIRIGARLMFDDDDPRPSTVAGLDDTGLGTQTGDPVDDLAVGDCYQDRSSAPVVSGGPVEAAVEEISCAEPHDAEVFLVTEIARDEHAVFPGEERAFDLSAELCLAEFAGFVGVPYESSSLDFMVLYPSAQTWSYAGDRAVVCAVTTLDGSPLTFPVQNSGL